MTDKGHRIEGVCTCPHVERPGSTYAVRRPALTCGLSSHRIWAAAAAELNRKD